MEKDMIKCVTFGLFLMTIATWAFAVFTPAWLVTTRIDPRDSSKNEEVHRSIFYYIQCNYTKCIAHEFTYVYNKSRFKVPNSIDENYIWKMIKFMIPFVMYLTSSVLVVMLPKFCSCIRMSAFKILAVSSLPLIAVTIQMDFVIEYAVYVSTVQFSDIYSVKFPWSIFIAGLSSIFGTISCVFYHLVLRSWLRVRRFSEYYQGTEELPSDRFLISETF
uniref:Uncharacterized protein LOC111111612 n=1 Tax=Crassostrea virginica TaxID=6565 RepID=A0A8B8BNH0_CRAVI|nr:uncharacterized protein LOC111111612 [Crassostrea virginica]